METTHAQRIDDGGAPPSWSLTEGLLLAGAVYAGIATGFAGLAYPTQAEGSLVKTDGMPDKALIPSLLTLSDVMATGWHAAVAAGVRRGGTAVVVGDGAEAGARALGASLGQGWRFGRPTTFVSSVLAMAAALLDVAGYGDAAAVVEDPTSR